MQRLAYSHGCLLARLPESLAGKIRKYADSIPDEFVWDDGSGENGREDKPHVTVWYGVETTDPAEVQEALSGFGPLQLTLGDTSVFHNEENNVLKMRVEGRDLFRLNRHVGRTLDCVRLHPGYQPHVTIAYLVKDDVDDPHM